jgi:5-methylcytosine-specific restriction endonuclease McrA
MTGACLDRRRRIDELDRAIVADSALMNRTMYRTLAHVREFDELAGYLEWSFESCAQWLAWRCDIGMSAARERVRVAHALDVLPQISEALALGTLSYSKARALTRVATRENEAELLAFALRTDAVRVEERVRQMRNVRPESTAEAARRHAQRALRVFRDVARGTLTITLEVPLEQGELVCRAIDKAAPERVEESADPGDTSWLARQADALVDIAQAYLAGGSGSSTSSADCYQVVVHVDATALKDGEGRSDLPVESVRRLTCDGSVLEVGDGPDGEPLTVGRKRRTIPPAIRRALWSRDRGCAFPGCTHTRLVDAHHVRHWALGGETSLDNLVLLCSAHHARVHEGGIRIVKDAQGRWRFRTPDGRAIPERGYRPQMIEAEDGDPSAEGWHDGVMHGTSVEAAHPSAQESRGTVG